MQVPPAEASRMHCPPPTGDHVRLMPIQPKKMNLVTFENEIPASKLLVIPLPSTHHKHEMLHSIDNGLDKISARTTIASPVAFLNAEDGVKIEKMYDFSCIDKRNNMSWADIIRQVGETLTSPVESLARESQIVHYHNSLGEGCPGQPDSKRLQEYAGRVDAILSGVMQLIPGANPLMVLQLIVGPALEIYADELDEKPLDLQKINNINQQVLICSRKEIQTLSAKEKMRIFPGASTNEIIKKLDTINGEVAVKIGEEKYVLHNDLYDSPFIEIDGVQRYIHFNNKDKTWVFNAENDIRSSSYLSSMKIDTYKSNFSYNADNDFIITPDDEIVDTRNKRKYLLINGKEVHVIDGIEKNSFFPASSIISGDVIKKGEGEYYFEAESAPVDSEVAEILNVDVNEFISGGDKTSIKPNLLSLDNNKHRYVKYHNLYHPLENGSELFIERIDGSLAIITTRSGRLSVAKVVKQNLPDAEHLTGDLFITRDLKIKLEQEGATLNYSGYKSSDGMKFDADSLKNHLQINNNVYKSVHSSHSPWIFVENKKDGYPDIPVFLYDDVLIQGKEGFMEDTSS
ncbi:hypothetical protein [unidentified bacterial endosymbiont]|uniref:hypothetical protein n=1 Tax=unidentified bacterial endosymbiont TaxID=2355 RepID=UPI00209EBAA1|nr:hypothetical protein [unidentified bacterial endosymbiont]